MLKIQDIKELIRLIDKSTIDELKIDQDGTKLTLRKNSTSVVANAQEPMIQQMIEPQKVVVPPIKQEEVRTQVEEVQQVANKETESLHKITSPMVGTFYAAPSPDSPPYVKEGDKVQEETVVCIVEAMKLMNEIEAEVKGSIVEVLVENGQLVEYGQPLFLVKSE